MPRIGEVSILCGAPGFALIKNAIAHFGEAHGTVITSSNNAAIAQIRNMFERNEQLLGAYESGEIEIRPLGELVGILADSAENPVVPVARKEHQVALAAIAAQSLPNASEFYESAGLPGFHEAITETLQELRRAGINPQETTALGTKFSDIASFAEAFDNELQRHRLTTLSHRLESLLQAKPSKPASIKRVLWVGETEWHSLWLRFATWLVNAGARLAFTAEVHPYEKEFFSARAELRQLFPDARIVETQSPAHPAAGLFSISPNKVRSNAVTFFESSDEFLETEWAIRFSLQQAKDGKDSCIYVRNLDNYAKLLHAAAKRFGVSLQMAHQERLLNNLFAQYLLSALAAARSGSLQDLAGLIMSGYSGVPQDLRRHAAEQIRECAKSADPLGTLKEKSMDAGSPVPAWISNLLNWRTRALSSGQTIADWLIGLNRLVASTPWLDASGDVSKNERDAAAQDAMVRSLEISKLSLDPARLFHLSEFCAHCEQVWSNATYFSRSSGEIRVVSNTFEIGDVDHVIAVGVLEGSFPRRRAEDPILLDRDRTALSDANHLWNLPSSYEKAEEGRREFYRLASSAANLLLSYPLTFGGNDEVRSSFLEELRAVISDVPEVTKTYEERFPSPAPGMDWIDLLPSIEITPEHDAGDEVRAMQEEIRASVRNASTYDISNEDLRKQIAELPKPLKLRHLRSLRRCPFQYICIAKLDLCSNRPKWVWDRLATVVRKANIMVANLALLRENLMQALTDEIEELKGKVADAELELVAIAAPRVLSAFAEREMAARNLWKISPALQNASLREAGLRSAVPLGDQSVVLDESVDVVYRRAGSPDMLPMRYSYLESAYDKEFEFEAGLLMALRKEADSERSAAVDSLQTNLRLVIARRSDKKPAEFLHKAELGLLVDKKSESAGLMRQQAAEDLKNRVAMAMQGSVRATPGTHCERCDYSGLCRKASIGDAFSDIWEGCE